MSESNDECGSPLSCYSKQKGKELTKLMNDIHNVTLLLILSFILD